MQVFISLCFAKGFFLCNILQVVWRHIEINPKRTLALINALLHEKLRPRLIFNPRSTLTSFRKTLPSFVTVRVESVRFMRLNLAGSLRTRSFSITNFKIIKIEENTRKLVAQDIENLFSF